MTEAGWTATKPTVAGFWWWRQSDRVKCPYIVEVDSEMNVWFHGKEDESRVDYLTGEWLGPLSPTDRQQGKVEGIQESKNLVSEFIEAWLLAGMVAKLLTPAVHEAVGGLSRDLRRELQKIEQAAQDEKGVGDVHK